MWRCRKCGREVSETAVGVKNRDHCPACLYSLHVDIKAGDRLNDCRGLMKPVGLKFKEVGPDKYGKPRTGELMLVNKCEDCGAEVYCRIAGDDDEERLGELAKMMPEGSEAALKQLGK